MSKISEGYYNLAAREKHTILELMENHPELSKKEMAEMLGITPSCLASKQKQWGVFVRDKRGRPTVKVDTSFQIAPNNGPITIHYTDGSTVTIADGPDGGVITNSTPPTITEVPVFHTVVKDEGEE